MGKGRRRPKKKSMPEKMGSDGRAAVVPAPRPPSGGATGEAKDAPVANRECINCDNCGVANPQKCCSRCFLAYYCSKECQLKHWKDHKQCCAILKDKRDIYNAARDKKNLPGGTPTVIEGPCAICLEEEVKHPVTFECGHAFCFQCIFVYQSKGEQPTCPYCRGEIPDVLSEALNRFALYAKRAIAAGEESDERKRYCHLAMSEVNAAFQNFKDTKNFLGLKAEIISLSKDPKALLTVADKLLLGHQSREWELDQEQVFWAKLWQAQAYSEMGKWVNASKTYSELRKGFQQQQRIYRNKFLLEMGHCRCHFELGNYDKAVELGNLAVSINRNVPGVHEFLALSQKAAGDIDAARKTMSKAILHEERWNVENLKRNKQILRDL